MNHTSSFGSRALYVVLTAIFFDVSLSYSRIGISRPYYGLFFLLMIGYYLLDILNFRQKYKVKDLVLSLMLNSLVFYVYFIFYKNGKIFLSFVEYSLYQNLLKYLICYFVVKNTKTVGILGENPILEKFLEKSRRYEFLGKSEKENLENFQGYKMIYTGKIHDEETVEKMLNLKMSGTKIMDDISFLEYTEGKVEVENIESDWVINSSGFAILNNSMEQRIKRAFDLFAATIVLVCSLPFICITYIMVKLMDNPKNFFNNPAFFIQDRIGQGGDTFKIIKFRSMRLHNPEEHSKYAGKDDNRIPPVGKFIRKTRLDELPQLWNVFKGDMSFVGPRPEWDILGRDYEEKIKLYKLRYAVKPGLTGWAQVMYPYGANLEDTKRKLEYDVYYIKHQSFMLDLIIFFKTVKTVVFGKGM